MSNNLGHVGYLRYGLGVRGYNFETGELSTDLRARAVDYVVAQLEPHKERFDTIAVRGASGLTIGSIVAYLMGKTLTIVRKREDLKNGCHFSVEGHDTARAYVVVDDLIDSGDTLNAIRAALDPHMRYIGQVMYSWRDGTSFTEADK